MSEKYGTFLSDFKRISLLLCLLLACSLGYLACSEEPSGPKSENCKRQEDGFGPAGKTKVTVETVVTGLEIPWSIGFLDKDKLLVTERGGKVRLVQSGKLLPKAVHTVKVSASGEGGLLGLALHPDFSKNRYFYLYFTFDKGSKVINRVVRYELSTDATTAKEDKVILDDIPSGRFHNGGRLRFGPDGMLYVGTGDARDPDLSQDKVNLAGKILRIDPEGGIPKDNPFSGSSVYIWGIRNTQGFDWPNEKTMYVTDHGPSGELGRRYHDEVSVAKAGDNLGWPTIYACETKADMVSPVLTWSRAVPPGGAAIYTGSSISDWKGSLLIASLGSKHLHRVSFTQDFKLKSHEVYFEGDPPSGYGRLRDAIMGPDGHLYITTSNCDGRGKCPGDKDRILRLK